MMRDNGYQARTWAFLTDVAPPIAMELLELLGTLEIAARSTPYEPAYPARYSAIGPSHALNRGPLERVDVDSERRAEAIELMQAHLPGVVAPLEAAAADTNRVDNEFRQIVAGLEPVQEPPAVDGRTAGYADPLAAGYGIGENESMPNLLSDSDDGFTPPPPPPIPRGTTRQRFAWAGMILGPLYLFIQGITGWGLGPLANILAIGVVIGSFVYLLSTLRDSREDDDDGAVV